MEKEMATHSRVLAWRIPGMEPGGLPFMGSHRFGHNWSDLAAASLHFVAGGEVCLGCKHCSKGSQVPAGLRWTDLWPAVSMIKLVRAPMQSWTALAKSFGIQEITSRNPNDTTQSHRKLEAICNHQHSFLSVMAEGASKITHKMVPKMLGKLLLWWGGLPREMGEECADLVGTRHQQDQASEAGTHSKEQLITTGECKFHVWWTEIWMVRSGST